jgi:hypothetical protein
MQTYNFENISLNGTGGNQVIYTCTDNGMPDRPDIDDPNFDPAQLYFGEYRNSIVISMSITNNANHMIYASLFIRKEGFLNNPVLTRIEIPAGGTIVMVGEEHKLVLANKDSLELIYTPTGTISDSDIHIITSVMNIYDYSFIPPIYIKPPVWYGGKAFVGFGQSDDVHLSTFYFSNRSVTNNVIYDPSYMYYGNATSNSTIGVMCPGYSDNNSGRIRSVEIASNAYLNHYADLGRNNGYGTSAHGSSTNYYFGGGYGYQSIHVGSYSAGETCTFFGNITDQNEDAISAMGNNIYGLWCGGYGSYTYMNYMRYITLASQSDTTFWGYLPYRAYFQGTASIEEFGFAAGNGYSFNNSILQVDFSSQGNAINWGNLSYSNGRMGGCNDSEEALFVGGGNNRFDIISFASGGTAVSLGGFNYYRDGALGFSGD